MFASKLKFRISKLRSGCIFFFFANKFLRTKILIHILFGFSSFFFCRQNPNKLREETTPTTKRGRQTLCNSIQQRGIGNDELIKIRSAKTFDQLLALIKRQSKRHSKNNRSEIDVFCTSNNSTIDGNRKFVSKSPEETSATSVIPVNSTVRRNFTTKKHRSQFETKAPANYCNSLEHRTIHKSNQNRSGHVSINNQNKTDWFIELASDCYKSGFQLHLNYLNECAKNHRITIRKQNKSIEPSICQTSSTILHLPSSALFRRSVSTEALTQSIALSDSASCASDIVSCTLKNSKKPHCDRHTNPLINDRLANCHQQLFKYHGDIQFQQQSTNQTNSSIISIEKKSFSSRKSVQLSAIRTIPNNCYSSQSTTISSSIIPEQNLSNNKIDAKNNMSAVAVDANEQQTNPQLSCQAIQFNNNYSHRHRHSTSHNQDGNSNHLNSQFRQNIGQFNEHPDQLTINNNYYQLSGKVDSDSGSGGSARNHIPLHLINSRCEVKQTTSTSPTASPVINDLIKSFNNSLDVSDIDKRILPQIVLSDFSTSDLTTPPISSLLFATQSIHSFSTLDSATSSGFLNLS